MSRCPGCGVASWGRGDICTWVGSLGCCLLCTSPQWDLAVVAGGVQPWEGPGTGNQASGGPLTASCATQQFSPFPMDRLECGQLANWRASPPTDTTAPPEQQLHPEGSDLLYTPPYSLPFSYRYGHCPLDPHVFSSKKPVLPAKFGPQGSPCEVARFFLSALPAGGECQWHYANPLVPGSPSPAKNFSEPPVNTARHSLVPNYEGGSHGHEGRGWGCGQGWGGWRRTLTVWAHFPLFRF